MQVFGSAFILRLIVFGPPAKGEQPPLDGRHGCVMPSFFPGFESASGGNFHLIILAFWLLLSLYFVSSNPQLVRLR